MKRTNRTLIGWALATCLLLMLSQALHAQEQESGQAQESNGVAALARTPEQEQAQDQARVRSGVSANNAKPAKSAGHSASKKIAAPIASASQLVATPEVEDIPPALPAWRITLASVLVPLGISGQLARIGMTGASADILGAILLFLSCVAGLIVVASIVQAVRHRIADKLRLSQAPPLSIQPVPLARTRNSRSQGSSGSGNSSMVTGGNTARVEPRIEPGDKPAPAVVKPGSAVHAKPATAANTHPARLGLPAEFDEPRFLRKARVYFLRLQLAWDKSDLDGIRQFASPPVFAELRKQILERGESDNCTDVLAIQTVLLGVQAVGDNVVASVKFTGMIKETASKQEEAFEEVWRLSKPKEKQGDWVLAGIQQYS
jgi:predicted lipid-binding transport protein (Tim44 family)